MRKRNRTLIVYLLAYVLLVVGAVQFNKYKRNKAIEEPIGIKLNQTINMDLRSSEKDSIIKYYLKD